MISLSPALWHSFVAQSSHRALCAPASLTYCNFETLGNRGPHTQQAITAKASVYLGPTWHINIAKQAPNKENLKPRTHKTPTRNKRQTPPEPHNTKTRAQNNHRKTLNYSTGRKALSSLSGSGVLRCFGKPNHLFSFAVCYPLASARFFSAPPAVPVGASVILTWKCLDWPLQL